MELTKVRSTSPKKDHNEPVSLVICAKNEESNLKNKLPKVLKQQYPVFETLIIDDNSEDHTALLIKKMQNKERYLTYHKVIQNNDGKKGALKIGLDYARHSWLLLTDADCSPKSGYWIQEMLNSAKAKKAKIILGYSPYYNNGSVLNQWIHFEGWLTGIQYLSFAIKGTPYMGVGRNLLYHRSILKPELLEKHMDLMSGDDDLTINQVAHKSNTHICISPDSFVMTDPVLSWLKYFRQKRRHFSTAHRYKFIHKLFLSLFSFSHLLFYVSILYIAVSYSFFWALIVYITRLILILPVAYKLMKKLDATFKLWMFPFLEISQCFFYILFSFAVLIPKKNTW